MSTEAKAKTKPQNAMREEFARFLEDPSRDKLHALIRRSGGEFRDLDFKVEWPSKTQLAKQVLGLGNIGGGLLVIGVEEQADGTLKPVGLPAFTDKADVTSWLKGLIPSGLLADVQVHDFDYPSGEYGPIQGMKFQVLFVTPDEDQLPFLPMKEAEKIVLGTIYIRRDGMVEAASYEEVQRILNRRIERGHSTQPQLDLKAHIDQLRLLYSEIEPRKGSLSFMDLGSAAWLKALGGLTEPNPSYPTETIDQFLRKQLDAKKRLIGRVLGTDVV